MIIKEFSVLKMAHDDPRYPEPNAMKRSDGTHISFSDVYICEATATDGQKFEAPWFVGSDHQMTPDFVADILRAFSAAVAKLAGERKAA